MRKYLLLIIFTGIGLFANGKGKNDFLFVEAQRVYQAPDIDGNLNDRAWERAQVVSDFKQYSPDYGNIPRQKTEVRIVYDNRAVYIGAIMYDSAPDSILRQLGTRDAGLNADYFGIAFDTYNNQQDAYVFEVSASGVQRDYRHSDGTYDGVWESAVKITDFGWVVEMRIPYSALRFPGITCQTWGLQIWRNVRRHRELNQWAIEEKKGGNNKIYWGQLRGICDVNPPLQLALTPYLSLMGQHYDAGAAGVNNYFHSFSGGMDLKYGINESYTFDMTLMPDFSQVPSDNVVKNLSAFETVHGEERPFFKESVDLFRRGDLLYSRRIGARPMMYNRVSGEMDEGEILVSNPSLTRLVNAFKVSGRSPQGTALGVMNAITANTYAVIEDVAGEKRNFLTQPLTNYNILVVDQALKNNSSFYLSNSNVMREGSFRDANATAAGVNIASPDNRYMLHSSGVLSQLFIPGSESDNTGYKYNVSVRKTKGNFLFNLGKWAIDNDFNINDLGLSQTRNESQDFLDLNYNIYEPFWSFRDFRSRFAVRHNTRHNTGQTTSVYLELSQSGTLTNYLHFWNGIYAQAMDRFDYYEAREAGRFYVRPRSHGGWLGASSDYRKPLAFDVQFNYGVIPDNNFQEFRTHLRPVIRMNDHFSFDHSFRLAYQLNDIGYSGRDSLSAIVFGRRDITTVENVFSSNYVIVNDVSLSFRLRQYWSRGEYDRFFVLREDGRLGNDANFDQNKDFNFNSLNVDLVFTWLFAPGSSLNLVWKNAILNESQEVVNSYFENMGRVLESPQFNSISLKLLYYIDYQQIFKGA